MCIDDDKAEMARLDAEWRSQEEPTEEELELALQLAEDQQPVRQLAS